MRTELHVFGSGGATAAIECPLGYRIRVLSLNGGITGAVLGEWPAIVFSYQGTNAVVAVGPVMADTAVDVQAFVGATTTQAQLLQNIDPGTGDAAYQSQTQVNVALPDIWFDRAIIVSLAGNGLGAGGITSGLYEMVHVQGIAKLPGKEKEKVAKRKRTSAR